MTSMTSAPLNLKHQLDYQPSMSLDMAMKRSKMLSTIRQFFATHDVLEVQTPLLSQAGNTEPLLHSVTATVDVEDKPKTYYLHTSPEFAMKRLLASWQVPIYQICPVFRNNEVGTNHNSEFTMLEWYRPHYSLTELANELSNLLTAIFGHIQVLNYYTYTQAFMDYVGIHPMTASCDVLSAIAEDKGIDGIDFGEDKQGWLDLLFSHLIEPNLGFDMPTLITDYPPATAALAKISTDREGNEVACRFELYINGIEIANAYDELADKQALKARFDNDNRQRQKLGLPIVPIDEHLLVASDDLMPCSGIALGLDRLLMVLTGAKSINEVITFGIKNA